MAKQDFPKAQRILYLISRYISGVIDFTELQELDNWKKESQQNRELFEELLDQQKQQQAIEKMQSYNSLASLQKVKDSIAASRKKVSMRQLRITITAEGHY